MSKHIDLINAWKDGAIIQVFNVISQEFEDVVNNQPGWIHNNVYRVKVTDAERIKELEDMLDVTTRNAEDGLKQVKAKDIVIENLKLSIEASNRFMGSLTNERQELRREVAYQVGLKEEVLEKIESLRFNDTILSGNFNSLHAENKSLKENQEYNERVIERKSKEYAELNTLYQREIDNHANTRKNLDVANRRATAFEADLKFTKELNGNQATTIAALQDKIKFCQECNGYQHAIIQDLQSKWEQDFGEPLSVPSNAPQILEEHREQLQTALTTLPKHSPDGDAWYGVLIEDKVGIHEFDINIHEFEGNVVANAYIVVEGKTITHTYITLEPIFKCEGCPACRIPEHRKCKK